MTEDINKINFKEIVDAIDDSVLITDKDGRFLYANPSHKANTGIDPSTIIGRTAEEVVQEGRIFTGGAVMEVLKTEKKAFRLSTVYVTGKPQVGYVTGVPIFDEKGNLSYIVATSRPIYSLMKLKDDYKKFIDEIKLLEPPSQTDESYDKSRFLIGSDKGLKEVWDLLLKIGPTDATVLITGESGVGKEVVADEIFRISQRKDKPFVKLNCASIPDTLLESELFGYEKGAFSGAGSSGKKGLFEVANGGTLLLDEIGDMPLDLQAKLLRAIQSKTITRVGGTTPISLDIRIIASTNSDLKSKVSEGKFRQDLFYRLSVIPINVPPLRKRPSDIKALCENFINVFEKKHGRRLILTESQYSIISSYSWPGNVRELENVIEYLTICADTSVPEANDILIRGILDIESNNDDISTSDFTLKESSDSQEKALIIRALGQSSSLREAGKLLGVDASTVSRKIKKYGIEYSKSKS